jgi:hypothetical protein
MNRPILSAIGAGIAFILIHMNTAHAQAPNGMQEGGVNGAPAVAYYAARCRNNLVIWILLDNGHLIQYDADHMPEGNDWGKLLHKLEGLPNSVVDLCPVSKM